MYSTNNEYNVGGYKIWLYSEHVEWDGNKTAYVGKKLPGSNGFVDATPVIAMSGKTKDLCQAIRTLANDKETLKTERKAAETSLRVLLKGAASLEKLFKMWPEGKKFYSTPPLVVEISNLPEVQMVELNKMLGIETKDLVV
jgi:Nucleotide modification associated domain 5